MDTLVYVAKELSGWVQIASQLATMVIVYLISRLFPGHGPWNRIWVILGIAFVGMLVSRVQVVLIAREWFQFWMSATTLYVTPLVVSLCFPLGFWLLYRILSHEPPAPIQRELPDPAGINTDEDSFVTAWDVHAEAMFGWTAAEAIGRRVTTLIIPEHLHQKHLDGVAKYLRERDERTLSRQYEVTAHDKNNREFPVVVRISVVPQPDGRIQFAGTINKIFEG